MPTGAAVASEDDIRAFVDGQTVILVLDGALLDGLNTGYILVGSLMHTSINKGHSQDQSSIRRNRRCCDPQADRRSLSWVGHPEL